MDTLQSALPNTELDSEKRQKIRELLNKRSTDISGIDALRKAITSGAFIEKNELRDADISTSN